MRTNWSTMIRYFTIVQLRYYWNELRILFSKEIVIVYTMAKVGSSTIYHTLKENHFKSVFHIHNLDKNLELECNRELRKKGLYPDSIPNIKSILNHIKKNKKCKIISIVRDPISRNVSAFFEAAEFYTNGNFHDLSNEQLQLIYNTKMFHNYPLQWFDNQIGAILNIDIYKNPFDLHNKYTSIQQKNIKMLIFRSDLNDHIKIDLLNHFLDSKMNKIHLKNIGTEKYYHTKYQTFKSKKFLDKQYLSEMLSSKYALHFYSNDELETIFKTWINKA